MTPLDWQWTNDSRTEARADRWVATRMLPAIGFYVTARWVVTHADFGPIPQWIEGNKPAVANGHTFRKTGDAALASFLAWLAAQPVTLEHREGEYVHLRNNEFDCLYQFVNGVWFYVEGTCSERRTSYDMTYFIENFALISHGFLAPGTITAPQPPEPTGFGYVGQVTDDKGDVWQVSRTSFDGTSGPYLVVRLNDGADYAPNGKARLRWSDVLALGTFEAVTK